MNKIWIWHYLSLKKQNRPRPKEELEHRYILGMEKRGKRRQHRQEQELP
jgi:hypothetical protein